MAKLTRQQQQIFAGQAPSDMIAAFGTTQTGTPVYSTDLSTLQTTNYQQGWQDAVIADKAPFLEEMNGVMYGTTYQLAYLMQQGIAEWDSATTYYTNSRCMGSDGNIYTSLVDENTGNNPTTDDGTHWNIDSTDINDKITNCILEAPNGVAEWSGVTPTGSLTNSQGVVSGFSESNYLTINKTPETVNSFEMEWCVTTGDLSNSYQVVTGQPINCTSPQLQIDETENPSGSGVKSGRFCVGCGISNNTWGNWIYSINKPLAYTTYWLRVLWDGTTVYFYLKTSKEVDWELQGTTQQSYVEWSDVMEIGIDSVDLGDIYKIWQGSIDLSQSYIKINGEMWWQGNDVPFNKIRVKSGIKALISNGRNYDRTLKNIVYTMPDTQEELVSGVTESYYQLIVKSPAVSTGLNTFRCAKSMLFRQTEQPALVNHHLWFNPDTNLFKRCIYVNDKLAWVDYECAIIAEYEVENGNVTFLTPYQPITLVDSNLLTLSDSGKNTIANFSSPSDDVVDISGQVIAGEVSTLQEATQSGYINLRVTGATTGQNAFVTVYNNKSWTPLEANIVLSARHITSGTSNFDLLVPVREGQRYSVNLSSNFLSKITFCSFIPLEGAK